MEMLSEKEKEDWTIREFKLSLVSIYDFKDLRCNYAMISQQFLGIENHGEFLMSSNMTV